MFVKHLKRSVTPAKRQAQEYQHISITMTAGSEHKSVDYNNNTLASINQVHMNNNFNHSELRSRAHMMNCILRPGGNTDRNIHGSIYMHIHTYSMLWEYKRIHLTITFVLLRFASPDTNNNGWQSEQFPLGITCEQLQLPTETGIRPYRHGHIPYSKPYKGTTEEDNELCQPNCCGAKMRHMWDGQRRAIVGQGKDIAASGLRESGVRAQDPGHRNQLQNDLPRKWKFIVGKWKKALLQVRSVSVEPSWVVFVGNQGALCWPKGNYSQCVFLSACKGEKCATIAVVYRPLSLFLENCYICGSEGL